MTAKNGAKAECVLQQVQTMHAHVLPCWLQLGMDRQQFSLLNIFGDSEMLTSMCHQMKLLQTQHVYVFSMHKLRADQA